MGTGSIWLCVRRSVLALMICGNALAQSTYRQVAVHDGGSVTGIVRLQGAPPREESIPVTKDPDYCGRTKQPERLILGRDNGVKNAVVWIEHIAEGKKFSSQGAATMHQKKCAYEPHVLILHAWEELEIVNDDPILHNVHAYDQPAELRSMFNIAQPVRGFRTKVSQERVKGAGAILTTCDAGHPWMCAYIIRAPHPYYAVTDGSGRYRLDDIPPGRYVMKMWHEGVATRPARAGSSTPPVVEEPYELSRQIVVPPYESVTLDLTFALRSETASK